MDTTETSEGETAQQLSLVELAEPQWERDGTWMVEVWALLRAAVKGAEHLDSASDVFWETNDAGVLVDELVKVGERIEKYEREEWREASETDDSTLREVAVNTDSLAESLVMALREGMEGMPPEWYLVALNHLEDKLLQGIQVRRQEIFQSVVRQLSVCEAGAATKELDND